MVAWQQFGLIVLCDKNWPKFPEMPDTPGLYRITLNDERIYIGEAGSLKRRLYEYRRPTPGIEQEHRVHGALVAARGGRIEIYTEGDLSTRQARMKFERAEIERAVSEGRILLNNETDDAERLRAQIKYYEGEVEKIRRRLVEIEAKT